MLIIKIFSSQVDSSILKYFNIDKNKYNFIDKAI